jgi:Uncharacterised protein conserved in bacteria (DUF2336)
MPKSTAYPPLDGLFDLACRDGVDIRPTLLRVLTDLYVQKPAHSSEEETQYVELALGLIDAVDAPTRAVVAARLSSYGAAPQAVLRRLNGEAEELPPATTPAADDLAAQFFRASSNERRLILTNLDAAAEAAASPAPTSAETIRRLEAAALTRNTHEFTGLLERALNIGHDTAARIVRDHSGEPIVVAAKALGMKAAVLQRILLFLDPAIGQSVKRVFDLAELYDEITPAGAARMLAIWRKHDRRAPAQYVPQFWDDETYGARSQASPARRQPAQAREPNRQRSGTR